MKIITFALLLLASTFTVADDLHIALGGWSTHLITKDHTNETHNIVAAEYKGYSAGYFKNSYGRDSFFVSRNWRKPFAKDWEAMWGIGLNYGYTRCMGEDFSSKNVCPHAFFGVGYTKYVINHTVKLAGDAVVYSPELRFNLGN